MAGLVEFEPSEFKILYPDFKDVDDEVLRLYFRAACLLLDNGVGSKVQDLAERKALLFMLVCHIATLKANGNTLVGTITAASEGKVSVSLTPFQNANWYGSTHCGMMYWLATAKYRQGMRYNAYRPV